MVGSGKQRAARVKRSTICTLAASRRRSHNGKESGTGGIEYEEEQNTAISKTTCSPSSAISLSQFLCTAPHSFPFVYVSS